MDLPDLIEIRSDVMVGKPCLKGTRKPVYLILEKLAAGETTEEILLMYPKITRSHVGAALQYAADIAREDIVLAS